MNPRTRLLTGIVLALGLALALLWKIPRASPLEKDAASSTSLPSGETSTVNTATHPDAVRPPGGPVAGNAPAPPSAELAPSNGIALRPNAVEATAVDNSVHEAIAAAPPASNSGMRGLKIAADCWGMRGSAPLDYSVTLDREVRTNGAASALISSLRDTRGYTTLFQTSAAGALRGKRVEFSADVRTRAATGGAYLLLRAADANGDPVAFDNMTMSFGPYRTMDRPVNRAVKGDSEWSTEHVVVDIPENAAVITYGVSLEGTGKAWIDNAHLEMVSDDVETTGIPLGSGLNVAHNIPVDPASLKRKPRNLDFDVEKQPGAAPCN